VVVSNSNTDSSNSESDILDTEPLDSTLKIGVPSSQMFYNHTEYNVICYDYYYYYLIYGIHLLQLLQRLDTGTSVTASRRRVETSVPFLSARSNANDVFLNWGDVFSG